MDGQKKQMDGWMDGYKKKQMDTKMEDWMDRKKNGWLDGWIKNRCMVGWKAKKQMKQQMVGWIEKINGWLDVL